MNTNLNTVLKNYSEAVAMHKKPEKGETESKLDHPILILETKKGVKQLKLIKDRKELSWFSRFLAFLGIGNASLVNVKNYLNQHKSEISKNNITVLGIINSKIALRNLSSRIQNITPINIEKESYGCGVMTTYICPENVDKNGKIDFTKVFPESRIAYVADGTGHAKDKKTFQRYEGFWNEFNSAVRELPKPTSKDECLNQLKKFIMNQSSKYLERGCGGTLTITQLFIDESGKKHLIHVSVGDSDLYCLRKNGKLERIIPIDHSARNGNFEGDLRVKGVIHCGFTVVEAGDKIVGVTDGITDFMSDNVLKGVLTHNDTTPSNLIEKLYDKLISGNTGGSKKLDRNDSHGGSDDISAFMMIVPEK